MNENGGDVRLLGCVLIRTMELLFEKRKETKRKEKFNWLKTHWDKRERTRACRKKITLSDAKLSRCNRKEIQTTLDVSACFFFYLFIFYFFSFLFDVFPKTIDVEKISEEESRVKRGKASGTSCLLSIGLARSLFVGGSTIFETARKKENKRSFSLGRSFQDDLR